MAEVELPVRRDVLGRRLKAARVVLGITVAQLADRVSKKGGVTVSTETISRIERGERAVSLELFAALVIALDELPEGVSWFGEGFSPDAREALGIG